VAVRATATLRFALLITGTTGFVDAYTYLERDGVFANAQTGNVVLGSVAVSDGHWVQAGQHLASIVAFAAGIAVAAFLAARERPQWAPRVEVLTTGLSALALLASALVPASAGPMLVTIPLCFTSAMQIELFRSIGDLKYVPIATTGNLMRWVESGHDELLHPDRSNRRRFAIYCGVVGIFAVGALAGALLSESMGVRAALIPGLVMAVAALIAIREEKVPHAAA